MKRKLTLQLKEEEGMLDISSLIDVCFLLLIYFVVTTTIQASESDLSIRTNGESDGVSREVIALYVEISEDGAVSVGSGNSKETIETDIDSRELSLLDQRLELYKSSLDLVGSSNQPMVVITASSATNQQRVIDVLNSISKNNIQNVSFTDLVD